MRRNDDTRVTPAKAGIFFTVYMGFRPAPEDELMRCVLALAFIALTSAHAADAPYPAARPVRLVSPFAAGGSTDIIGRLIAPKLGERLGRNVIVENRPGAGGMIGTASVARATPDGHTLLFISGAFTAHSAVTRNLPYDPVRDFAWVSTVLTYPFVVVVKTDSPTKSVSDLIATAKKNPRKLNYGSVGAGSVFHLAAELFGAMTGTEMTHIPFKGGAEPTNELMAGRLDVIFTTLTGAYGYIEAKRIRPIAVTSLQPAPKLPGVPTLAQTVPGYEVMSFNGIGVPRATPRAAVVRLNREIRAVVEEPQMRQRLTDQGGTVQPGSPEDMAKKVRDEIEKWQRTVTERKLEL